MFIFIFVFFCYR